MTQADETRRVVQDYFSAWTTKRTDEAYALLSETLLFSGPSAEYRTREAFRPGLIGFAALSKNAHIVELLVEGDRAALLYDCELPPPVGKLRIASFFRVEGSKIQSYDTRFDAEAFRKLVSSRGG
jgi:hypothetical protein